MQNQYEKLAIDCFLSHYSSYMLGEMHILALYLWPHCQDFAASKAFTILALDILVVEQAMRWRFKKKECQKLANELLLYGRKSNCYL
jgi:hypothetical protein